MSHPTNTLAGWTGGQYSMVRVATALYLAAVLLWLGWRTVAFASLTTATLAWILVAVGLVLAALFAVGWYARPAVVGVLACFVVLSQLLLEDRHWPVDVVVFVSIWSITLLHAIIPAKPFGSWAARGRVDPADGWQMPIMVIIAAWVVALWLAGAFGMVWLALLCGMLALWRHARPWVWMLLWLINAWAWLSAAEWSLFSAATWLGLGGLVMLHLLMFEPRWLAPKVEPEPEVVFYDGDCGLCQTGVRLLLSEDISGRLFDIAPLHGQCFEQLIPPEQRAALPDSIVVRRADGRLLIKSAGTWHALHRLGGLWRIISLLGRCLPRPLADMLYDLIAATRHRLWRQPTHGPCPLLPEHLRPRFRA